MTSSIIHDNIWKLIHKKCHSKSYHSDIEWRVTLIIIFSVDNNDSVNQSSALCFLLGGSSGEYNCTLFMVFSVTCPILRHMLGYTNKQQLHHECHLMSLGVQAYLLISWHEKVWYLVIVIFFITLNIIFSVVSIKRHGSEWLQAPKHRFCCLHWFGNTYGTTITCHNWAPQKVYAIHNWTFLALKLLLLG